MGIAIGATGLLLLLLFAWMLALSMRQKRLDRERRQRDSAYRKAIEHDRKQEQEDRLRRAEAGDITMILYLAKEEERTNLRKALYWYHKAAMQDNVIGMYGIIRISERMSEDMVLRQQAKFWRMAVAAMEGDLSAKYDAAEALFLGRGVEQNIEKAYLFMEEAALMHHLPAMLFLGNWFIAENNPHPDPQLSFEWYLQATKLKSNEGRMKLGLSYINGIGVEADFMQGCYWLERAGEKGYTPAMLQLGHVWSEAGGPGKYIAYIWLFLAGQLGDEDAREMRDKISLTISVDTVVGLQALAKPMLKRVRENKVGKHALIKALNRLYKREMDYQTYDLPSTNLTDELLSDEQIEDEMLSNESSVPPVTTTLNYSESPMDSNRTM
nr:tetratricopeptide repeat protein [Vibrio taketomensis]